MTDEELDALVNTLWNGEVTLATVASAATAITTLRAQLAEARAERDDALRGKECFQRMTRAHWDALCAMRNEINEYIPMPNTDSGPLFSPEDGPIYADIAERVIADLKESRAYALALEAELKARADRAEAALAAQIEVDAGLCGQNEMAIPMDHTKRTLGGLYCADVWCGEGKHAGHGYADLIRSQPHDRTALDRMLTEAREVSEADKIAIRNKALLDAVDACRLYDAWGECRKAILAMIEKPNAR